MKKKILSSGIAITILFSGITAVTSVSNPIYAATTTVKTQSTVNTYQQAWENDAKVYAEHYRILEKYMLLYDEEENTNKSIAILQNVFNLQKNFQVKLDKMKPTGMKEIDTLRGYFKTKNKKEMQLMDAIIKVEKGTIDEETFDDRIMEFAMGYAELMQKLDNALSNYHEKYNLEPSRETMFLIVGEVERYTVKKGDTLHSIAAKSVISVDDLKSLNGFKTTNVKIGQSIFVVTLNVEVPKVNYKYVVKKGDYLDAIAKKYGLTVNQLKQYNNLKSNVLKTGQVLIVKKVHTVQKGDTLQKIAKKYGVSVKQLKEINGLLHEMVFVGQKIVIK